MSSIQSNSGKLRPNEETANRSVYVNGKLSRTDYSVSTLSQISFTAMVTTREISIQITGTDVDGDISVMQSLDNENFATITGSGLPVSCSAVGDVDASVVNISGVAGTFLKIVFDKTAAGSNPFVAVNCIGTGV